MRGTNIKLLIAVIALSLLGISETIQAQFRARDPGVRGGSAGAGGAIEGLTAEEQGLFAAGLEDFEEVDGVGEGLGPRFNLDSCLGCHAQPATGGSSPAVYPQVAFATKNRAPGAPADVVPPFIRIKRPRSRNAARAQSGWHGGRRCVRANAGCAGVGSPRA